MHTDDQLSMGSEPSADRLSIASSASMQDILNRYEPIIRAFGSGRAPDATPGDFSTFSPLESFSPKVDLNDTHHSSVTTANHRSFISVQTPSNQDQMGHEDMPHERSFATPLSAIERENADLERRLAEMKVCMCISYILSFSQ